MPILRDILQDRESTMRFFASCNLDHEVSIKQNDGLIELLTKPQETQEWAVMDKANPALVLNQAQVK